MNWSLFQPNVNFIVGANTYDIPITNMRVSSGPYSREVGDNTAIRAFDGRFYQKHQGWRTRATFDWPEMTEASQADFYTFIADLATVGVCTVVFNPDGSGTAVDMVLEDPTQALKAQFSLNARGRPASISMVSSNITAAAPVFITAAGDDDAIFWTGADGFFYTTSGDLSRITNTGLDISSLGTHKLDFHAIQNKVFAVSSGAVYSWNLDGSDFGLEFDTGHGDITAIHINSLGNSASLTTHNAGPVNNRYKIYNLATGAETYDLHFFKGLTSYNLTSGQWAHDQGRTYFSRTSAIIYVEPATNIIDGLGSLSHLACQDICIDEIGNIAYHLCSPGVYYQSTETVGTDTLLTGTPVAQTQIDLYESGGVKWIIGNNFRVQTNGSNYTTDWASGSGTSVNQLCTRRPF